MTDFWGYNSSLVVLDEMCMNCGGSGLSLYADEWRECGICGATGTILTAAHVSTLDTDVLANHYWGDDDISTIRTELNRRLLGGVE
jgi:ribosomal protein S27AE